MTRELLVGTDRGPSTLAVTLPDGWAGPDDTYELAVLFPEGREGFADSFATNTVVEFLGPDAPVDPVTGGDSVVADTGPVAAGSGTVREVLSVRLVGKVGVVQLTTECSADQARVLVISSVPQPIWDRFAGDVAAIHSSVRLTEGSVR